VGIYFILSDRATAWGVFKMKNKAMYIIIILVVLVGGLLLIYKDRGGLNIYGSTVLSLDQVALRSSIPELNNKQGWVYTMVQSKGLAQSAYGSFSPEKVEEVTGGDKPTQDFEIDVTYHNQECVYPINWGGDAKPVFMLDKCEWNCVTGNFQQLDYFTEKLQEECGISPQYAYGVYGKYPYSVTCYATYMKDIYNPGYFGNTDIRTRMTVDIGAGGRSGNRVLDTEGSIQGPISDFAYVTWQGNLDTGKSCKYTTHMPYRPVWNNGWNIMSKDKYDEWKSNIESHDIRMKYSHPMLYWNGKEYDWGKDGVEEFVDDVNDFAGVTLVKQNMGGSIDNKYEISNGVVRLEIEDTLQLPVITMFIDAETMGIHTYAPELEIVEGNSECFKTGADGFISVVVKNVGDSSGSWSAYGECDNPFDVTRRIDFGLKKGETKAVYIPLSADANERTKGECTITFEGSGKTWKISVDTCVDPHQSCAPNYMRCNYDEGKDRDIIEKCKASGTGYETTKTCRENWYCDYNEGAPVCKNGGGGDEESSYLYLIIIGAVAVIIGMFVFSRRQQSGGAF